MAYVDLRGEANDALDLKEFSIKFFKLFGIEDFNERSSANYTGGAYFLGHKDDLAIKISIYDIADSYNLPFWVHFSTSVRSTEELVNLIGGFVRNSAIPHGLKLSRFIKLGRKDGEVKLDY